ncbi:hypothetical protein Tco_1543446 [Tanacetum coccineum]
MEKRVDDGCTLWIKSYSKYEYETRYHPGKANMVIEVLRGKERVKPRCVRAMAMTIQYGVRGMILVVQSEAFKQENEVDINKKTENQAKMTKLSMEWKRLCKIKAKVQKCQSQSQY